MHTLWSLRRVVLAMLSLAAAWGIQFAIGGPEGSRWWVLFPLYVLLVLVFVLAVGRRPLTRFAAPVCRPAAPDPGATRSRVVARVLVGLAVGCTLAGVPEFAYAESYGTGWLLHVAAILLFVLAFVPFSSARAERRRGIARGYVLAATVIFGVALFVRLWELGEFPFGTWYDEASNGLAAIRILEDPSYRPVYVSSAQTPAHFHYLLALSFLVFGPSTAAIRLVPAAFGVLAVVFAYLLFTRWFGLRLGLVATALIAVMRYDLTVSRFGMQPAATPAFELAFLFFLDRACERRRARDFAWMGLTLGLGGAFYFAFRLFPVVPAIFTAALALGILRRWRHVPATKAAVLPGVWTQLRQVAPQLGVFALGFAIATAPIIQFAVQHPDLFFERTSTVSIFHERDEPNLAKALWNNTRAHLLMFNLEGDGNGRHNVPGEPMLDPLTASLFLLGLALALRRWRDPPNFLMLLVFFVMLLGGILSLDYEAPQSLRSIGVVPALAYFATLPLAALGVELGLAGIMNRRRAGTVLGVVLAALLVAVATLNLRMFFGEQKLASNTWSEYSTMETLAAREMKRLAPTHELIVAPLLDHHPTVRFLAPEVTASRRWTIDDRVPLAYHGGRGVAILFDPSLVAFFDTMRRVYPQGVFREFRPPRGGEPLLYEAVLSPYDLQAAHGIEARYYLGNTVGERTARDEVLADLAVDWITAPPIGARFFAEFRTTVYMPQYGNYQFSIRGPQGAALTIDGWPVGSAPVLLAIGNHDLRLRVPGQRTKVELWWQPPGWPEMELMPSSVFFRPRMTSSGLLGSYYASPDWSGSPAFARNDPEIAFYFQELPLPRPYTVEWSGKIFAPQSGPYQFATESIDESFLSVDGKAVVENSTHDRVVSEIGLERGWHDIRLRFADRTSHTQMYLYWKRPSGSVEVVPSIYLSPPRAEYPDVNEMARELASLTGVGRPKSEEQERSRAEEGLAASEEDTEHSAPLNLVYAQSIGTPGSGLGELNAPGAVIATEEGTVFVADTGNRRVQVFDRAGRFVKILSGVDEPFAMPVDLDTTPNGEVVVLDSKQGFVHRFDRRGNPRGRFGGSEVGLYNPRGLAAGADGTVYVADTGSARIVRMSQRGEVLRVLGTSGDEAERLAEPVDVAVDAHGFLFVTDVTPSRIVWLNREGQFLRAASMPSTGSIDGPHIVVLPDHSLLVTAPEEHRILHLARSGQLIDEWGKPGDGPGQLRLPTGISVRGQSVWVADTGNDRVQRWEIR
jgi:sugar lactone lactonase YvrE